MNKPNNQASSEAKTPRLKIQPLEIPPDPAPIIELNSINQQVDSETASIASQTGRVSEIGNDSSSAALTSTTADNTKLYGQVIKSWISGGAGGTGARSAMIVARYFVSKDINSGEIAFVGTTFELTFTDIDNETTSTIPNYAFKLSEATSIPGPEDGGAFDLNGTVMVSSRPSGRLLVVDFDMSRNAAVDNSSTPRSTGSVFQIDIPNNTKFAPLDPEFAE